MAAPISNPIDHLVLPTADLALARVRLGALGFTVAPVGVHPFGTVNCCVYLKDGTFLEPLAIGDSVAVEAAVRQGNVFVARDAAFRSHHGHEGFSALVFGTADAAEDDRRFCQTGISAGDMLEFSRPFVDAAGNADTASFKLAFAADCQEPRTFFFACERVNAPKVGRTALERHPNGVSGLNAVVLAAEDPLKFQRFLENLTNADESVVHGSCFDIAASTGTISVLDPLEMSARFGIGDVGVDLRLRAVVFAVADLAAVETLFRAAAIPYERRDHRIVVPPAPGQGATFAFEAAE